MSVPLPHNPKPGFCEKGLWRKITYKFLFHKIFFLFFDFLRTARLPEMVGQVSTGLKYVAIWPKRIPTNKYV